MASDEKDMSEDMLPSRSEVKKKDATMPGRGFAAETGEMTDGELTTREPGSRYSAVLNERANKSIRRNAGPDRPSANDGMVPGASFGQRKTGKV